MESKLYDDYKFSKLKLLNKYKRFSKELARAATNEDTFISINDFLAEEQSLGPDTDPGKINYSHTNPENINNYMKIMLKEIEYDKIVCIPNIITKNKKYTISNSFTYNETFDFILIDEDTINEIKRCFSKRFIYIIFDISHDYYDSGHANILIIDNLKKTIERFDPLGHGYPSDTELNITRNIDRKFTNDLLKKINLQGYKYLSPFDISPRFGIQFKADAYGGMCSMYTLIYLQLRLMNPDINQKIIIKYLLSKEKDELIDIILKYTKYVENILKKHEDMIEENKNLLYHIEYKKLKKFLYIDDNGIRIIAR
jgi:hypothetical protein